MTPPRNPTPKKSAAWMPAPWGVADAAAIQALARGDASDEQQKRALTYIIERLCGTYEMSYRPESSRDTDFAEGKRSVGNQIVKLLKLNLSTFKEKKQ